MPSIINSDDGVVSGSSGLKTTGGNDGILALQNNGTTNVTVTAAGNVGIGTSSPAQKLHVQSAGNTYLRIQDTQANGYNAATLYANDQRTFRLGVLGTAGGYTNGALVVYDETASAWRMVIDSSGNFQFNSGYGSVATAYGCRAWVNFNGTGTVAIRGSGNVTSITDVTTGTYNVNFATALTDANYSAVGCAGGADPNNGDRQLSTYPTSSSVCRVVSGTTASVTKYDADQVMVAFFR